MYSTHCHQSTLFRVPRHVVYFYTVGTVGARQTDVQLAVTIDRSWQVETDITQTSVIALCSSLCCNKVGLETVADARERHNYGKRVSCRAKFYATANLIDCGSSKATHSKIWRERA